MKKEIELSENAQSDLRESSEWYDDQKQGLGEEFIEDVQNTFNKISNNPYQFQKVKGSVRRALLQQFSFGVFYIIKNVKIIVFRVVHTSRSPREWKLK